MLVLDNCVFETGNLALDLLHSGMAYIRPRSAVQPLARVDCSSLQGRKLRLYLPPAPINKGF